MGRNVTIYVNNQTGYLMSFKEEIIDHGKFNLDPPREIAIGETGVFKVGNNTGAKVGPKGTLTYTVLVPTVNDLIPVDLKIFWDHPFSASISTYTVTSVPPELSTFSINPSYPEGHDQTITLTINLKTDKIYSPARWMKALNENLNLSALTIPGTHDSGAYKRNDLAKCQTMSIEKQLESGIRFLDIRLNGNEAQLRVFHGSYDMYLTFNELQQMCADFLRAHPSECILMLVNKSQSKGDPIGEKFVNEIQAFKNYWWLEDHIPTLKDVKGKIVLIRRFDYTKTLGINVSYGWKDDSPSFDVDHGNIHVQDKYKVWYTKESVNGKWNDIHATMAYAQTTEKMVINFTSGGTAMTPVTLATGKALSLTGAECINTRLYNTVSQGNPRKLGILAMDFPESPNPLLIDYIIRLNKF